MPDNIQHMTCLVATFELWVAGSCFLEGSISCSSLFSIEFNSSSDGKVLVGAAPHVKWFIAKGFLK